MEQLKKKIANTWEYKVGINANITSFVRLWKPRMDLVMCKMQRALQEWYLFANNTRITYKNFYQIIYGKELQIEPIKCNYILFDRCANNTCMWMLRRPKINQ